MGSGFAWRALAVDCSGRTGAGGVVGGGFTNSASPTARNEIPDMFLEEIRFMSLRLQGPLLA